MKRILCTVLAVLMLSIMLVACNGEGGGSDGRPTLTMATNAEFPPFEFINDAGQYDGFDVELARAIADYLDMRLVIDNMAFDAVLVAVETGVADVAIAAITITPERAQSVAFTMPYFETDLVAIVMEGSDITSTEQLAEARIVVQLGTTSDLWADLNLPNASITRLQSPPDTIPELRTGRADAIIIDREVANQFISDASDLVVLDEELGREVYGMAIALDNTELLDKINGALESLKTSGEYDRIFDNWFGA